MTDIYKALNEWLQTYPSQYSWVYFNAIKNEDGTVSMNSSPSERKVTEYIDGSYEAYVVFDIAMIIPYDVEQSDTNYQSMDEVQRFMNWIDETDTIPDFGSEYLIRGIEVLTNTPNLTVDEEQNLAKYLFTARVNYLRS